MVRYLSAVAFLTIIALAAGGGVGGGEGGAPSVYDVFGMTRPDWRRFTTRFTS